MNISKPNYKLECSEEELKEALEYWLKEKYGQDVEITHLKHLVGERTEGYGGMEVDVPYQEGLLLTCTDKVNEVGKKHVLKEASKLHCK